MRELIEIIFKQPKRDLSEEIEYLKLEYSKTEKLIWELQTLDNNVGLDEYNKKRLEANKDRLSLIKKCLAETKSKYFEENGYPYQD